MILEYNSKSQQYPFKTSSQPGKKSLFFPSPSSLAGWNRVLSNSLLYNSVDILAGFNFIRSSISSSLRACHCFHNKPQYLWAADKSVKGFLGVCMSLQAEIWEEFYIFSCLSYSWRKKLSVSYVVVFYYCFNKSKKLLAPFPLSRSAYDVEYGNSSERKYFWSCS